MGQPGAFSIWRFTFTGTPCLLRGISPFQMTLGLTAPGPWAATGWPAVHLGYAKLSKYSLTARTNARPGAIGVGLLAAISFAAACIFGKCF
jgi:hypothetical protein